LSQDFSNKQSTIQAKIKNSIRQPYFILYSVQAMFFSAKSYSLLTIQYSLTTITPALAVKKNLALEAG
jgi:hypothetical protein